VEPIARAQIGALDVASVWRDLVNGLPRGLAAAGDAGLDHTHTWGRTYWGGALFCLLAELEIRQRTGNRQGVQHALQGLHLAGGSLEKEWPISRVLQTADQATGGTTFQHLYGRMADQPMAVDLEAIWKDLGVIREGDGIRFDDRAMRADTRLAITQAARPS